MTGSVFGQLGMVLMGLFGIVTILRARRNRGKIDETEESRRAKALEMERRMASYLAARDDK
jgi:hypothetical protein